MHGSHWILLFPYFFFGSVTTLLVLILATRLTRAPLRLRLLSVCSAFTSLSAISLSFLVGGAEMSDFTVRRMFALAAISFVVAIVDYLAARVLHHPIDEELAAL